MEATNCVKKILTTAAAIMRKGGIVRGTRYDSKGAHCLLGAIDDALLEVRKLAPCISIDYSDNEKAVAIVADLIPARAADDPFDKYNDFCGTRTIDETNRIPASKCAWYSNMMAKDAEDVAVVLEKAAATL